MSAENRRWLISIAGFIIGAVISIVILVLTTDKDWRPAMFDTIEQITIENKATGEVIATINEKDITAISDDIIIRMKPKRNGAEIIVETAEGS